jgi:hypothetical protein
MSSTTYVPSMRRQSSGAASTHSATRGRRCAAEALKLVGHRRAHGRRTRTRHDHQWVGQGFEREDHRLDRGTGLPVEDLEGRAELERAVGQDRQMADLRCVDRPLRLLVPDDDGRPSRCGRPRSARSSLRAATRDAAKD